MIPKPGDANRDITVTETFHLQTDDELSDKELKQEIWLRVQQMMKGSDIGIQEKKAKMMEQRYMVLSYGFDSLTMNETLSFWVSAKASRSFKTARFEQLKFSCNSNDGVDNNNVPWCGGSRVYIGCEGVETKLKRSGLVAKLLDLLAKLLGVTNEGYEIAMQDVEGVVWRSRVYIGCEGVETKFKRNGLVTKLLDLLAKLLGVTNEGYEIAMQDVEGVVWLGFTSGMKRDSSDRHFFKLETWKVLWTLLSSSGSSSVYATGPALLRILNGPMLSPYTGITPLPISCSLQVLSNMNYLFGGFMDYLWSRELDISNFSPVDWLEAYLRVFGWFFYFVHRYGDDMMY
nr:hypothetical protein [Tanacetum cinerariifolium]